MTVSDFWACTCRLFFDDFRLARTHAIEGRDEGHQVRSREYAAIRAIRRGLQP